MDIKPKQLSFFTRSKQRTLTRTHSLFPVYRTEFHWRARTYTHSYMHVRIHQYTHFILILDFHSIRFSLIRSFARSFARAITHRSASVDFCKFSLLFQLLLFICARLTHSLQQQLYKLRHRSHTRIRSDVRERSHMLKYYF